MYTRIALGVATNALYVVGALLLFAGFGPPVPLPGIPSPQRFVDIHDLPPPSLPLEGPFAPNDKLRAATVLFNGTLHSSESLVVEEDGSLLLMDKYGYVLRATPDSSAPGGYELNPNPITRLGLGRPLGFRKHPVTGHLIVCVAGMGLVEVRLPNPATGTPAEVVLLTAYVSSESAHDPGSPIQYANALDIAADGSAVYFTDSQAHPVALGRGGRKRGKPWFDTFEAYMRGVFSGQFTGRLLAYYPANRTTVVLLPGLFYPNGVALAPDEAYVAFAGTNTFDVRRLWLKGDKAGDVDVLIQGLPGAPDGVSRSADGKGFWITLPAPRTKLLDAVFRWRVLRVLLAFLPPHMRPRVQAWGAVALVTLDGQVAEFLMDPTGSHISLLSSAEEHELPGGKGTRLWLATVSLDNLAYLDLL